MQEIKIVQSSDYNSLCHFLSEFPEDSRSYIEWMKRLQLWWDENPACDQDHIRGVVLRFDGCIVGFSGNIPTRMIWGGKEITVISGTTWRVLPQYRKYSMDMWLKHRELTSEFIYFNTTPNLRVKKLLSVLKFTELPNPETWFYYIGSPSNLAKSFQIYIGSFLQKLSVTTLLCFPSMATKSIIFRVKDQSTKDEEIDKLWYQHKADFQYTNVRDSRYLNWLSETKVIYFMYKMNELLGYIILNIDDSKKSVILVDYWSSDIVKYAKSIFNFLLKTYRDSNIIVPSFDSDIVIAANNCLMFKRKNPNVGFIDCSKHGSFVVNRSFLTMLQGDYGM